MNEGNREDLAKFLLRLRSRGITEHHLLSAFEKIPRKNFVPIIHITEAYAPGQMPIECGQSMIAVSLVAKVLHALEVGSGHRVLELGTGTGYQTALLCSLAEKVTSIERYRTLYEKAQVRLSQLGLSNVILNFADGSVGNNVGVYDRIVANFAFEEIPCDFVENLASNGIMIAPIGPIGEVQMMKRITKTGLHFQAENLFQVRMQHAIKGVSRAI